jgi:septum formation topological specificity factor MinE
MGLIHTYITEKSTSAKGNKMRTKNVLAKSKHDDTQNLDALFDMRVDIITEGMIPYYTKTLKKLPYANAQSIVNFVMALNTEIKCQCFVLFDSIDSNLSIVSPSSFLTKGPSSISLVICASLLEI